MLRLLFITIFAFLSFVLNAQVPFDSTNLPLILIETENNRFIVDEPRINANMKIISAAKGYNKPTDPANDFDGNIAIELRGQTSQSLFEKKSYRFETQDNDGENLNVELLGMPKENDWILYGPYSDKTLIRNVLAYGFSRRTGQYAARTHLVELLINGEYEGVYVLTEKIKRDKNRVAVKKLDTDDIAGDSLTGGYLFRTDKFNNFSDVNIWSSAFSDSHLKTDYQVIYPKPEDLQPEQFEYITDYFGDFERALFGDDFQDPELGFKNYIDQESFIDYFLINELARNPDAYRISTYFYKKRDSEGGKIHAGPVWDFNIAFGNVNFCAGPQTDGWVLNYHQFCPNDFWQVPVWWDQLFSDPEFSQKTKDRWKELRAGVLRSSEINLAIDSLANLLQEPQRRNFERWPILTEFVWPNPDVPRNYRDAITDLKGWLASRLAWMDKNMEKVSFDVKGRFSNGEFKIFPNPVIDQLTIELKIQGTVDFHFNLFDATGKKVSAFTITPLPGQLTRQELDPTLISSLSQGIYYLQIFRGEEQIPGMKFLKL